MHESKRPNTELISRVLGFDVCTYEQAQNMSGYCRSIVQHQVSNGTIKIHRSGRFKLLLRSDVVNWIKSKSDLSSLVDNRQHSSGRKRLR